jgi:hypothetical protein
MTNEIITLSDFEDYDLEEIVKVSSCKIIRLINKLIPFGNGWEFDILDDHPESELNNSNSRGLLHLGIDRLETELVPKVWTLMLQLGFVNNNFTEYTINDDPLDPPIHNRLSCGSWYISRKINEVESSIDIYINLSPENMDAINLNDTDKYLEDSTSNSMEDNINTNSHEPED